MQPGSHQLLPRASPDHKRVAETQGAAVADAHGLSASAASLSEMIQQSPGHGSTLVSSSGAFPIPIPGPCRFLLAVGAPRCCGSLSSHPALAQPEAPLGCVGWSHLAFPHGQAELMQIICTGLLNFREVSERQRAYFAFICKHH